jgi:hypothetical protein
VSNLIRRFEKIRPRSESLEEREFSETGERTISGPNNYRMVALLGRPIHSPGDSAGMFILAVKFNDIAEYIDYNAQRYQFPGLNWFGRLCFYNASH